MAFSGAQNVDARYSTFTEIHDGDQISITNINSYGHNPHAAFARFDSTDRQPCLEGTRKNILESVYHWISSDDSDTPRIFWINGLAGTGKTTIAYTVAKKFDEDDLLAGSFFCSRDDVDSSDPKFVFTTLADQLGQFFSPFQEQVARAHASDPGLKYSSVSNQLEKLIVKPLRAVRDNFPACVLVLDAIDECKDKNATSIILSSLSRHISMLAPLKFLVTSRPEPKVTGGFRLPSLQSTTRCLNLHEVKLDVVQQDIEKYLKVCLQDVQEQYQLDDGWPSTADVLALARLSSGLFIFAATAVNFIRDPNQSDPSHQLALLLKSTIIQGSSPHHYLDKLYLQVLTDAFPDISVELSNRLKNILGTIAFLRYPLFPIDIEHLLGLKRGTIRSSVIHLGSVLVVPSDDNLMIRLIHPSFFDFLTDPARCSNPHFTVDSWKLHALLANACLESMKSLKRDICQIGDPSKLDDEIEDMSERVAQHIPRHLRYACRHWSYHLSHSRASDVPLTLLQEFCSHSVLYWVEVCSLLGELRSALIDLDDAYKLISKKGNTTSETLELLDDCKRFIREFFPVLSIASSHTYYSALLFTPTETALRQKYSHEIEHLVRIHNAVEKKWASCLSTMERHIGVIRSVAVSPDGAHIASASTGGSLCLWDFETGAHLQCFRVHGSEKMLSVAFSPSGAHITAGSGDWTVRLWDVGSGICAWESQGHVGDVVSVAFAPDGALVASGSYDGTIRMWSAVSGIHLRTLQWKYKRFTSVAFSPNGGVYIAAGSYEGTIVIWNATTGAQLIAIGLQVMIPPVISIVFSPDATQIASGSADGVIRTWDAITGDHLKSFKRYSSIVKSIAYSPDGTQFVSGSSDQRIIIWDITGVPLKGLKGHTDQVTSVTYSSDGTQIVSGSNDGTVRIWGARKFSSVADSHDDVQAGGSGLYDAINQSLESFGGLEVSTDIGGEDQESHTSPLLVYLEQRDLDNCTIILSTSRIATWLCQNSDIVLWDVNGTLWLRLSGQGVTQILLSQNGAYLGTVSRDKVFRLYSGLDGHHLPSLEGDWGVNSAAFSPNGTHLAFGCGDATVKVWGIDRFQDVRILSGHSYHVYEVAFSPDGAYIVSLSSHSDPTFRVWSVETGTQVACFRHTDIYWGSNIHFSADQRFIIATSRYGKRRMWALPVELWPKGDLRTSMVVSEDGWLYFDSETPRRRVLWMPARWRSNPKPCASNGCLLCLNSNDRRILYITPS